LPTAESVLAEKKRVAKELFEGRCYICRKPFGKGFAFHHEDYVEGRKTHKDFPNTIDYNRYILPEVIVYPERFWCLCKTDHARIDHWRSGMLAHLPKDVLARLFLVAYRTIPKPKRTRTKGGESKSPVSLSTP